MEDGRLIERIRKLLSYERIDDFLNKRVPRLGVCWASLIVGIAIFMYTFSFSYFTILRHHWFHSSNFISNVAAIGLRNFTPH